MTLSSFPAIFTWKLHQGTRRDSFEQRFKFVFSDVGIYDRVVVQEIIKELAQTQQIDKSKRPFKGKVKSSCPADCLYLIS